MAILKITKDNFNDVIAETKNTLLIDFYADWCGPCKMIAPIIEEIERESSDITVGKVNVDEENEIAGAFKITAIPTLVLIKNGKPVDTRMGFMSKSELLEFIGK